ncbi:hypothetical protein CHS0354_027124, partial [Potamilus streckersoni]
MSDGTMRIRLFLMVICNFSVYLLQAQVCSKGPHDLLRFGPLCEYLCHCGASQCDRKTGECLQNVECDAGWMGSGCQYVNIAYGATATSNYLLDTQNIVDGKGGTCPSWNQKIIDSAYVTIDFGWEIKITEIHLDFSDSDDYSRSTATNVMWFNDTGRGIAESTEFLKRG